MKVIDARTGAALTPGMGVLHSGDSEASYEFLAVKATSFWTADVTIRLGTGRLHTFSGLPIRYLQWGAFRSVLIPS